MGTAKFIRMLPEFRGLGALYHVDPPIGYNFDYDAEMFLDYTSWVAVRMGLFYSGPETHIYPARHDGSILSWLELGGSQRGGDHVTVLNNAGYEIVWWEVTHEL